MVEKETEISKEALQILYIDKCWGALKLADYFNVSRQTIRNKVKKYGLKRKCDLVREENHNREKRRNNDQRSI